MQKTGIWGGGDPIFFFFICCFLFHLLQAEEPLLPQPEEEGRATGTIAASVYFLYIYLGTGVIGCILFVILNALAQGTFVAADWWLSHW